MDIRQGHCLDLDDPGPDARCAECGEPIRVVGFCGACQELEDLECGEPPEKGRR